MARLIPCSSCARHVRAADRDCPFCGTTGLTVGAPSRLSMLLVGLCLAACASPKEDSVKVEDKADNKADVAADTNEAQPEPADTASVEPEPVDADGAEPEPVDTAEPAPAPAPEEGEATAGTDDGSTTGAADLVEKPPPVMKPKYGAPRPPPKSKK